MEIIKCSLIVKYGDENLVYGNGKWWLYLNGVHLKPLNKITVNGALAYRCKGGRKLYYRSKMEKLVQKCSLEIQRDMPF